MERILKDLKPENVFFFFEEISRIPRNSGDEQAVSDYLVEFAKKRGLKVRRDAALNVVIDKPASPGYEDRPKVILQGHMDMVCVKNPGVEHDFKKDPIPLVIDGEFLRANGTSLGADDGNAVALCLAILDNEEAPHPPLQVILTTMEEIGCKGAQALDASMMDGDYLIGLDYSQDTNILVSCAGSTTHFFRVRGEKEAVGEQSDKRALLLKIGGLTSGHSGIEIIKGRANANRLLGELVSALDPNGTARFAAISGGDKKNVIPFWAEASVVLSKKEAEAALKAFESLSEEVKREYQETDPLMTLSLCETKLPEFAWSQKTTQTVLALLDLIPNGLQNYLDAERTLTKCSGNLGIVQETEEGIELISMVRSNSEYEHDQIIRRMSRAAALTGTEYHNEGRTPAWEYDKESGFPAQIQDIWEKERGSRPPLNIIHAEVETGLFVGKVKAQKRKLEAVNLGIRNYDVHTPRERLEIASLGRAYTLLLKVLEEIH
ncbi:MAG: aminoacyl-histidine dipeptidase [Lachnospiraceae bacterium]|nr:aminoacyl-histidine dipeptidase [Lachnospiraceae bacterium]